jgi:hypothetical protein
MNSLLLAVAAATGLSLPQVSRAVLHQDREALVGLVTYARVRGARLPATASLNARVFSAMQIYLEQTESEVVAPELARLKRACTSLRHPSCRARFEQVLSVSEAVADLAHLARSRIDGRALPAVIESRLRRRSF